jgi:hypothetical protein
MYNTSDNADSEWVMNLTSSRCFEVRNVQSYVDIGLYQ